MRFGLLGFLAGQIKTHPPIVSPFPQKEFRFLPIFFKNQIVVVNMVNASVVGFYSLVLLLGRPNILYSDSAKKKIFQKVHRTKMPKMVGWRIFS